MDSDVAIIIPTYNARNTIIQLIDKILYKFKNPLIIVVDDNSPDKTAHFIRDRYPNNKRVLLIVRKAKGGRGSAVMRGFQEGLKISSIKYFIEMDADLCHDPVFIPSLINATEHADVAIASRYARGAKNINWKLKRKLFSTFVSFLLKLTLRVPIQDYTNGFRCYSRTVIESIDFKQIKSKGFIVLSELAYYIHKKGFRFAEVPTTFELFKLNQSNLKLTEIREAIDTIVRLKYLNFRQREDKMTSRR